MSNGDIILNAMGNMLYYSKEPVFFWKEIQKKCEKYNCDGLFFVQRELNEYVIRYFDNDGTENFCGNANRCLPLVLEKDHVLFSVKIGGIRYRYSSQVKDGIYSTIVYLLDFQRLNEKQFSAFVGNNHVVTLVHDLEFDINAKAKEVQKQYGNVICSFLNAKSNNFGGVRVFEDNNVGETMSCCSSVSVISKVFWLLNKERESKLKYPGGVFSTRYYPNMSQEKVEIGGECKVKKRL